MTGGMSMVQNLVLLPAPQRLNYLEGALELEA